MSIPRITHGWVGDLAIELSHTDGPTTTTVELAEHPGGPDNSGKNFTDTVFDDEAAQNISSGTAPYTGSFRPQNDELSRFDGKEQAGDLDAARPRPVRGRRRDARRLGHDDAAPRSARATHRPRSPPARPRTSSSRSRSASFQFTATEAPGSPPFECRLDDEPFAACEAPGSQTYDDLPEGQHTFEVRAVDAQGEKDPSPATRTWAVDTVAPAVDIDQPLTMTTVTDPTPTLSGTAGTAFGDLPQVTVEIRDARRARRSRRPDAHPDSERVELVGHGRAAGGRRVHGGRGAARRGRPRRHRLGRVHARGRLRRSRRSRSTRRPTGRLPPTRPRPSPVRRVLVPGDAGTVEVRDLRGPGAGTLVHSASTCRATRRVVPGARAAAPARRTAPTAFARAQVDTARQRGTATSTRSPSRTATLRPSRSRAPQTGPPPPTARHRSLVEPAPRRATPAGVTVRIRNAAGGLVQELGTSASGGAWSTTAGVLAEGTYTVQAQQSDASGNVGSSAASTFRLDTPDPPADDDDRLRPSCLRLPRSASPTPSRAG